MSLMVTDSHVDPTLADRSGTPSLSARLAATLSVAASRTLRRGQLLLEERERAGEVQLVLEGLITAVKRDALGREVVVHLAEAGDLVGLEALAGLPVSAAWRVVVPARVRPLPILDLRRSLASDPELALELMRVQSARLAQVEEKVRDIAHKSARQRACAVLLMRAAAESEGTAQLTVSNLTRQDLAAMAGMTAETFIRILSSYREKGIVETVGRQIRIRDPKRLASIASPAGALA